MTVGSYMTMGPLTVSPDDSLAAAQLKMSSRRIRELPVVDGEGPVGILTDRDIRQHLGFLQQTKVNVAMSTPLVTVSSSSTLEQATRLLLEHRIGGLPVVDDGRLVGIITTSDLLGAFLELTGATEEGTVRIDLAVRDDTNDLAEVSAIVEREGGTTLSMGSYKDRSDGVRVFYVRIRADDPERVVRALAEAGYSVLGSGH
jgi:acetoin utilization protein AcuB